MYIDRRKNQQHTANKYACVMSIWEHVTEPSNSTKRAEACWEKASPPYRYVYVYIHLLYLSLYIYIIHTYIYIYIYIYVNTGIHKHNVYIYIYIEREICSSWTNTFAGNQFE